MSEYMEKASVSRLLGAPPGYIGYTPYPDPLPWLTILTPYHDSQLAIRPTMHIRYPACTLPPPRDPGYIGHTPYPLHLLRYYSRA